MNDKIKHKGIIDSIDGPRISVRILQTSACVHCKAMQYCNAADCKEKLVDVRLGMSAAQQYSLGEEVMVCESRKVVAMALLWSFGIPFAVLVGVLMAVLAVTGDELKAGVYSMLSLIPYYIVLFFFRHSIGSRIVFSIEKT